MVSIMTISFKLIVFFIYFLNNQIILEPIPHAIKDQCRTKCFDVGFIADTYFIMSRLQKLLPTIGFNYLHLLRPPQTGSGL